MTRRTNVETVTKSTDATPVPTTPQGDHFYSSEHETVISQDLLDLTTKAFSKALPKKKWKELITFYPQVKHTESLLVALTMEAVTKEDIRKRHGHMKTRELFTS